jgi:glucitol operon activator protein
MPWQLLVGAAVIVALSTGLGWVQQRAYQREVNRLLAEERDQDQVLVSGRAKGRLRGAVVLLVIERASKNIRRAAVMQGASVFARFHESPELLGPVCGASTRAPTKAVRRATADAVDRYRQLRAPARSPR